MSCISYRRFATPLPASPSRRHYNTSD
uniref:Uncharacterized protein n=1 Tax=Anguilla anguilla TaxID=7936 RepID=A0A0E9TLJ2_ANGAN